MAGVLCSMVGAAFAVTAVVEILRSKKGVYALGNAQLSTAQSKFGGASALFDGTGDYLNISNVETNFGTNDFTVEAWFRFTGSSGSFEPIVDTRTAVGPSGFFLGLDTSSRPVYYVNGAARITASSAISTNTWYHIALVRNSGTSKLFLDGTQVGSDFTDSYDFTNSLAKIGGNYLITGFWNGNIDEVRFSNTARYTADFTPPTQPFVNDDNTLLLLHIDGTNASTYFEDDNGVRNKKGIAAIGNAQVSTTQSKFGGASALFDGTGDYLIIDNVSEMAWGTGEFTIEMWFYVANTTGNKVLIDNRPTGVTGNYQMLWLEGSTLRYSAGGNNARISTTVTSTTWYHLALARSGTSTKMFINGTQVGSTFTDTISYLSPTTARIGISQNSGGNPFNGHIDELRISNTARYTDNFTAPTAPFVNDANTVLLIHADGTNAATVFVDDNGTSGKNITANGNAQISTAQSQFGGASALFDGTDDWLQINNNNDFAIGTNNFTIESWIRIAADSTANVGGTRFAEIMSNAPSGNSVDCWSFGLIGNTTTTGTGLILVAFVGSSYGDITASFSFNKNQWYHVAAVRNAGTVNFYVDGVSIGSGSFTRSMNSINPMRIGGQASTNYRHQLNGYIDELRVSNTARYTAAFTPSTTPFASDSNTLLLLHMNGANASTAFIDSTSRSQKGILAAGGLTISTAQSKFGGSSAYWNNTNSYVIIPANSLDLSGDFTFETWVYALTTDGNFRAVWDSRDTSGSVLADEILIDMQSGAWRVFIDGTDRSPDTLSVNTWYHIALVRNGTNFKFYIDGVEEFSYNAASVKDYSMSYDSWIGNKKSQPTNYWYGYMDELRFSSIARYTAAFTPSTTPFQNDANTLLLLHMDGTNAATTFVDDNGVYPIIS